MQTYGLGTLGSPYWSKDSHHQGFTKESVMRHFAKVVPDRPKIKVGVRSSYLAQRQLMGTRWSYIAGLSDPTTSNSKNGAFLFRFCSLSK